MLATSFSPASHTGVIRDVAEGNPGTGEDNMHSPMCATRLTIFRAPPTSKPTTPSTRPKTPMSPRSPFSASPLLKFSRGPAQPDTGHGDYFPQNAPADRVNGIVRGGGATTSAAAGSIWHPRTPTHIKTPQEMRGEVQGLTSANGKTYFGEDEAETPISASSNVKPFNIPGTGAAGSHLPSSPRNHSPDEATPQSTPALAPLDLTPLTDDILLPFADRELEVPALLSEPINQSLRDSLKRVLGARNTWAEFEQKLSEPRHVKGDQAWVDDLERLVREGDTKIWIALRGLLGADDLVSACSPPPQAWRGPAARADSGAAGVVQANQGMRMTSLDEGETVLRTSALFGSSPQIYTNRPAFLGLGTRRMSFESVFFSDSGSEAPQSPAFSNYTHYPLPPAPSIPSPDRSPARSIAFLQSSHVNTNSGTAAAPVAHSPHSPRHFRTRSHGGAIASPAFTMAAIQENEPMENSESAEGSVKRSRSSADVHRGLGRGTNGGRMSPGGHRMLGLRIVSLSTSDAEDTPTAVGEGQNGSGKQSPMGGDSQDHQEGSASPGSSAGGRRYRRRYSFGKVQEQGLGLNTSTGGYDS